MKKIENLKKRKMEITKSENTKELDEIYKKTFDCSMYPRRRATMRIIKFKLID